MFSSKWQLWIGLAVSVVLVAILVYQLDAAKLRESFAEANYLYVIPAVGLAFVTALFRSIRWRYLLSPLRVFPLQRLYPVVIIGYMSNNLLPVRLGEVVRSYYLARRENFSAGSALSTIAVERVFDGLTLAALVAVSAPWLVFLGVFNTSSEGLRNAAIVLAVGVALAFLALLAFFTLLATVPRFAAVVEGWLGLLPGRVRGPVIGFYHTFIAGLGILNSPRKHLALLGLSVPIWLSEGTTYYLVALSFGLDEAVGGAAVLLLVIGLVTATSNLATAAPSVMGGIGPFEVVAQQTLFALGMGSTVAAAYSGFVHLMVLWLPLNLVGLAILWKQNLNLKQLIGDRGQASPETASRETAPPEPKSDSVTPIPQPGSARR